jgi:hypothetical protein
MKYAHSVQENLRFLNDLLASKDENSSSSIVQKYELINLHKLFTELTKIHKFEIQSLKRQVRLFKKEIVERISTE